MDYLRLDRVRRSTVNPLQLDVVEAYAQGRLSRREFIQRAGLVGLSLPAISAVIAACGGGTASSAPTAGASAGAGESAAPPSAGPAGGSIRVAIQRPAGPLDPVLMQDLGSYGMIAQSFEFLAALNEAGNDIAPGLAESWEPNSDNSVWTFKLRQGATWQDGSPLTADDVVATMARMVESGNSGLKGVIDDKSTVATDASTITFNLVSANGNFPYLVSIFNAQSAITPAGYAIGTTLDGLPNGTGAWKLDSYDQQTGAKFSRNDAWWGGSTPLDSIEWIFFDEPGPMVTAYQGGQIDAIVQFDVLSGTPLFNDANFNLVGAQTTQHRQIWMRTDTGQFTDKRVRQALALTFDREAMIQQLFKGKADLGNDHVIAPFLPYFDPSVPQRVQDIEKAKALLAEAGATGLTATLHAAELLEIPDLAVLIKSGAEKAGINIEVAIESLDTFYGAQWCPAEPADPPCSGAAELGIVDYGHRPTPDVFLNSALKTKGVWNSSQYSSQGFDDAFAEFQAAVGVDAQKAACGKIETILNDEVPIGLPFFYNNLTGWAKTYTGISVSALGQMILSAASKVG